MRDEPITRGDVFARMYLTNVHAAHVCTGPCVIHRPTLHAMSDFPLHWRDDRGIFERICPHGIGHPDPDQVEFLGEWGMIHGCDGCGHNG